METMLSKVHAIIGERLSQGVRVRWQMRTDVAVAFAEYMCSPILLEQCTSPRSYVANQTRRACAPTAFEAGTLSVRGQASSRVQQKLSWNHAQ